MCEAVFKDARAASEHLEWRHADGEAPHACTEDGCTARFKVQRALRAHVAAVHGQKRFSCPSPGCSMAYGTVTCLKRHMRDTHEPKAPQPCPHCSEPCMPGFALMRHLAKHGAEFQYGRSLGENVVFRVLDSLGGVFLSEVRANGTQMRFDFWMHEARIPGGVYIEVDGVFHYRQAFGGIAGCMALLGQVHRDLLKSRFVNLAGGMLVRMPSSVNAAKARDAIVSAVTTACSPGGRPLLQGYVMPASFTHAAARALKAACRSGAPKRTAKDVAAHMQAVALALDSIAFTENDVETLPPEMADAVLALYLRQVEEVADIVGDGLWDQCVCLASRMPEFCDRAYDSCVVVTEEESHEAGGVAAGAGSGAGAAPALLQPVVAQGQRQVLQALVGRGSMDAVATSLLDEDRETLCRCWICDTPCGQGSFAVDSLLSHVNRHHGLGLLVKCKFCPLTFATHQDRKRHPHPPPCPSSQRGPDNRMAPQLQRSAACGVPGCTFVTSTFCGLFRHFNAAHGARFPPGCTLQCPTCGFACKTDSYPQFYCHVCA
jgi:hypothetical protein